MAKPDNPRLWQAIVRKVKASTKGSRAGEWSARSAQLAALEYKKRGGTWSSDSSGGKSSESLSKWTSQDWSTKDGGKARQPDGSTKRYLPKQAWRSMSRSEAEATDKKKRRRIKQFVANTRQAKRAGEAARR